MKIFIADLISNFITTQPREINVAEQEMQKINEKTENRMFKRS